MVAFTIILVYPWKTGRWGGMTQGTATPDRANQVNDYHFFKSGRFHAVISSLRVSFSWSSNSGSLCESLAARWQKGGGSRAAGQVTPCHWAQQVDVHFKSEAIFAEGLYLFSTRSICCFLGGNINSLWETFWRKWVCKEAVCNSLDKPVWGD